MIAIMSEELGSLLQGLRGRECEFAAGASVFHLGDPIRLVHFVRRGTIHLVRHQDDGAALILQRAQAGSILAEASVYSESYHCDARAETAAATWAVARKDFRRCLETKPEAYQAWAQHLAHEVQRARLHAEILSTEDRRGAAQRLDILERRSSPKKGSGAGSPLRSASVLRLSIESWRNAECCDRDQFDRE